MSQVSRPALKYFGSKWRMYPWISGFFPPHTGYIEPFCGGASMLLQKPPSRVEVMNDLDKRVINFFRVLREQPGKLVEWIQLTPWARAEQLLSYEVSEDPLEDARRFYVQAWQSFGGAPATPNTGWRWDKNGLRSSSLLTDWSNTQHLFQVADRLKNVHIECDDAFEVIRRYDTPDNLFYLDPPYVEETLSSRAKRVYAHKLKDEQQREFLKLLLDVKGYVVLSGYHSELYAKFLPEWEHRTKGFVGDFDTDHVESVWLNPQCASAFKQLSFLADTYGANMQAAAGEWLTITKTTHGRREGKKNVKRRYAK